ncbi:MAG: response regulator [Isosphaeraceae bacterium]
MPEEWGRRLARVAALVACIVAGGFLGQATTATVSKTSLIWLPTGIAVGLLFRWGLAYWPATYLGIFLVQFLGHDYAPGSVGIAVTGTLGTALAARLLHLGRVSPTLESSRDVALFLAAGAVGMVVTATGGIVWLWASGDAPAAALAGIWWVWWRGDFAGVLLAAPFLMAVTKRIPWRSTRFWVEGLFHGSVILVTSWYINIFCRHPGEPIGAAALIVFAAMRYGLVVGSLTVLACSIIAAWAVVLGYGSFESESAALFTLWTYTLSWSLINLMINVIQASSARDRQALEENLRRLNETTAQLLETKAQQQAFIDRLTISEQRAEQASQVKTQFLANMSHELRTPVAAILGFGEILLQSPSESPERAYASEGLRRNSEHLLGLVDDILDFSKIESGRVDIRRVEYAPAKLVEDVLLVTTLYGQSHSVPLSSESRGPLPACCLLDPIRLRQVLANLVNNAIKFSAAGSPVLLTTRYDVFTSSLVFDVIDRGVGISAENQAKLFRPFSQVDESMTRRYGGTGLGLNLSARLVEAMGGSIQVESREGEGSRFTVTVPAMIVLPSEPVVPPAAEPAASISEPAPRRVLLVEDSPEIRKILRYHLEKAGLVLDHAENGQLGVEKCRANRYDVILMDIQMPVLDGYQATRAIRAGGDATPIIALTANASLSDRNLCLAAGCTDYLTKPIGSKALLDAIARNLQDHPA